MPDDPTYTVEDYLKASDIAASMAQNLAIQFQIEGETWPPAKMQKHVNSRAALIHVQNLLLNEAERITKS